MKSTPSQDGLGAALGRVPSGLYILTVRHAGRETGMLASWVQQAGFDPPMVTVAVRRDRFIADWIAESGRFTLNQIGAGDKPLIKHFARGFETEDPAFEGLRVLDSLAAGPVLADALAWLETQVAGALDSGDHRIFLGKLLAGGVLRPDVEPMVHVRRNGFHY